MKNNEFIYYLAIIGSIIFVFCFLEPIEVTKTNDMKKEFLSSVDGLTNDYIDFMIKNGEATQSFFKGTFLGDDLNFCNEIRSAIEMTISESKKIE